MYHYEDPFGSASHALHPALSDHYKCPPDVYYPLVQPFLDHETYVKWALGYRPWQLHCYGDPGCGKTTFAAKAVEDLRKRYSGTDVRLASVFLRQPVTHEHATFVEDFLALVYAQLSSTAQSPSTDSTSLYDDYRTACRKGFAYLERLERIRAALHNLLSSTKHSFLVLDGYDFLDAASRMLLDHELKDSHVRNLSLLITRRLPAYQPERALPGCDGCGKEDFDVYWQCEDCLDLPRKDRFSVCYDCKEKGELCPKDGHSTSRLREPYTRVDMNISKPCWPIRNYDDETTGTLMETFIAREIGREYGLVEDQGTSDVDPLQAVSLDLVRPISENSWGNINIAKLRLDEAYTSGSLVHTDKVNDRLPRSLINFFDFEIERIASQSPTLRELALLCIAAVTVLEGEATVDVLEQLTHTERAKSQALASHPVRSIEDILYAANGLLVMQPYNDQLCVAFYNQALQYYVHEDYNESLFWAKKKLDQFNISQLADMAEDEQVEPNDEYTLNSATQMAVPSPDGDASAPGQLPEDEGYYSRDISRNTSTNSNIPTLSSLKTDELIDGCDSRLDDGQHEVPDPGPAAAGCSQNLNLCSYCVQTILSSTESHGTHHVTIEPARESVKSRCIFCTDLYGDQKNAEWTQYTWAIRSTGRTRNDRPSIAVAFRPAVRAGDSSQPFHRAIKYHVLSEQDMGSIPTEEALGDSTDPRISKGAQLRDWIKTCDDTHPHCYKHRDGAFVPTRLVDLDCEDQGMVRVVETKKHGINTRYCTLSHSWGAAQFLTLTTATESRLTGPGCRIDELTPNFQQAIEVARFIGLRYVWIDSLCIRQGEGGDFKTEGQLMHKVYRFSYCNIAIADSADSEGGLFRDRKPASAILPARYESDGRGKFDAGTWRIVREDLWERELLGTKIYTRGWVFQERMLSPRILHFAQSQIFWDCAKLSACETLPQGLPNALDTISSTDRHWRGRIQISGQAEHDAPLVGANDDSIETFWKNALLNYTSCNLTNQTDKTMAIWSIAKIARDEFLKELCDAYGQDLGAEYGEEYGGGLWTRALEEQLAWRMKNPGVEGARIPDLQIKNPSWSWASVKGPVLAHDRLCPERMYTVTKHDGESPIEFDVEDYGDNRDEEPTLKTFSLEMMGYKGKAALEETPAQGVFTMALPSANGHEDEDSGTFDVYLDEALAENGGREMDFIILAASATAYIGGFPREMTTEEEEGFFTSSNTDETTGNEPDSNDFYQPDFEGPVTYSGTGLLLTPHSVYAAQQNAVYQALRKELDARDPGFQEKVPWGVKTLKQKTEDMEKVVAMLAKREEEGEGEAKDWYRRVGAITFKGVGRGVWEGLKQGGMRKVWVA